MSNIAGVCTCMGGANNSSMTLIARFELHLTSEFLKNSDLASVKMSCMFCGIICSTVGNGSGLPFFTCSLVCTFYLKHGALKSFWLGAIHVGVIYGFQRCSDSWSMLEICTVMTSLLTVPEVQDGASKR